MAENLLRGELVHLTVEDPKTLAEPTSRWSRDSEFWRLMDISTARPYSTRQTLNWFEKDLEPAPNSFFFSVRTNAHDRLIGDVELDGICWQHQDAFVGIAIGEREFWGKGYGTDAMRVLLRFAFTELNLRRVTLSVFEYNPRAIRSYEKVGFVHEGRERGVIERSGRRWDVLSMGILRQEWAAQNP